MLSWHKLTHSCITACGDIAAYALWHLIIMHAVSCLWYPLRVFLVNIKLSKWKALILRQSINENDITERMKPCDNSDTHSSWSVTSMIVLCQPYVSFITQLSAKWKNWCYKQQGYSFITCTFWKTHSRLQTALCSFPHTKCELTFWSSSLMKWKIQHVISDLWKPDDVKPFWRCRTWDFRTQDYTKHTRWRVKQKKIMRGDE